MKRQLQIATLLLAVSLMAVAQNSTPRVYHSGNEWIEETSNSLPAANVLRVRSDIGGIHIQGAERESITYTVRKHVRAYSEAEARREFSRFKITSSSQGESTLLRGETEGRVRGSMDFEIQVPAKLTLIKVETGAGGVTANNLDGKLEAATGAGNIQVDQVTGLVTVSSGGGNVAIGKTGGDVRVETGGGSIHVDSAGGRVYANSGGGMLVIGNAQAMVLQTGGGSIRVNKCDGQLKASTGGGNIELKDIGGAAQVDSGGGAIRIVAAKGGVRAETGAGLIVADLAASRKSFSASRLETSVGDIIVYVPDDLGVTIRAAVEAARGNGISSDFPELKITRTNGGGFGPREAYAEGSLNGGGPVLHVHTTTGNIEFRRKKPN